MSVWHVVGLLVLAFVVYRVWSSLFWKGPKEGSQELVMAVWGSFGPYVDAEHAEGAFRTVCKVVFTPTNLGEQEKWMSGHIQVFHDTEDAHKDDFEARMQRLIVPLSLTARGSAFRNAHMTVREQALIEAREAADQLKESLGSHSDFSKLLDDTLDNAGKQIESERLDQKN